jgi:TfoX/Sxy family transcriptional regulator of competence genes
MFGSTAVMVDGHLAVAVHDDGSLLVRVDPAEDAQLLEDRDASRAVMGKARSMGVGWIRVEARALGGAQALERWVEAATRQLDQRRQDGRPVRQGHDTERSLSAVQECGR